MDIIDTQAIDTQAVWLGLLSLLALLGVVVRLGFGWLIGQVRGIKGGLGEELIRTMVSKLAPTTPDPDAFQAEESDTDRLIGEATRRMGQEVEKVQRPLIARMDRIESGQHKMAEAIEGLLGFDAEHDTRIGRVEQEIKDVTGSHTIVDTTLGESIEEL